MRRVLSLWLPSWPVQWRTVAGPGGRGRPLVVHGLVGGKERVVACSRTARRRGVRVGMLRGDADSLAGRGVRFEPADPSADVQRLRELVTVGQQFSPTVMMDVGEAPDGLLMDATGCGLGHGGEAGFA